MDSDQVLYTLDLFVQGLEDQLQYGGKQYQSLNHLNSKPSSSVIINYSYILRGIACIQIIPGLKWRGLLLCPVAIIIIIIIIINTLQCTQCTIDSDLTILF